MPKLSVSKKLKRSVDDFETPVRVSKPVPVQIFLKKCEIKELFPLQRSF
jgi:hypothetical protein